MDSCVDIFCCYDQKYYRLNVFTGLVFLLVFYLFFYLFFSLKLWDILRDKAIYLAALGLILGIDSYYLLAEWTHTGYLEAVWQMELLPRFQNTGGKYIKPETGHYINSCCTKSVAIMRCVAPIPFIER